MFRGNSFFFFALYIIPGVVEVVRGGSSLMSTATVIGVGLSRIVSPISRIYMMRDMVYFQVLFVLARKMCERNGFVEHTRFKRRGETTHTSASRSPPTSRGGGGSNIHAIYVSDWEFGFIKQATGRECYVRDLPVAQKYLKLYTTRQLACGLAMFTLRDKFAHNKKSGALISIY